MIWEKQKQDLAIVKGCQCVKRVNMHTGTIFVTYFFCMEAVVKQANITYFKTSISAYKYLPNSDGGLCLLKCVESSRLRAYFNY